MIAGEVSIDVQGVELHDVQVEFGMSYPPARERALTQGWGFSIELPAVLDILQAVAEGRVEAAVARKDLLEVAEVLYGDWDLYQAETDRDRHTWCERNGGCRECEQTREEFDRVLAEAMSRHTRAGQPDLYPYAVGQRGIHAASCPVVAREMPDAYVVPAGEEYVRALRSYAHAGLRDDHLRRSPVPLRPLTAEEARQWMADRTGPQGGRKYARCKWCAPTP